MKNEDLLDQIAETAYNVGFGAKKHFATYDIVDKIPGVISFLAIMIGILALFIDFYTNKLISAILIILGVIGIYISMYNDSKDKYSEVGSETIQLFNALKELYFKVKGKISENADEEDINKLKEIESIFYSKAISKQILFSGWFAHHKFFWEWRKHINWIEKQLNFTFFSDKVPLSVITIFILLILTFLFIILSSYISFNISFK